jgi:RHS repeat-associated protein
MAADSRQRHYDGAGNTIRIEPLGVSTIDPPPGDDPPVSESAAYEGTEQMAIEGGDGNEVPPGIPTKTFAYNAANRMASVSENGILTMSYRYTGTGERVYRSGGGQTAHTMFDANGRWIGDYDENGQAIQQMIWFGDLPVGVHARMDAGQRKLFYVQPDALGTPRVVIDPTRDVAVWRWDLDSEAFGETEPNRDPDGDNTLFVFDMRFPGQQYDSATGFNYNYFRDYDASTGRYVQSDPIGLRGGISTYSFVAGNPLTRIDSLGLEGMGVWNSPDTLRAWGERDGQRARATVDLLHQWRSWGHDNFPGERNSAMRHCTVSCITGRKIGAPTARLAGVGNEFQGFVRWDIRMLPSRFRGDTPWAFQWDDLSNNERGFDQSGRLSCGLPDGDLPQECIRRCSQSLTAPRGPTMPMTRSWVIVKGASR